MPNPKNFAVTALGNNDTLTLLIRGVAFDLIYFSCNIAVNEIPKAVCGLGVGRNARTGVQAPIHTLSTIFREMTFCQVFFRPQGEYSPSGTLWPGTEEKIWEGFVAGFGFRKMDGKITAIVHLHHWLIALAFSSALSQNSHPSNPAAMTVRAVMESLQTAGSEQVSGTPGSILISEAVAGQALAIDVPTDFWGTIKNLFCAIANIPALVTTVDGCGANAANNFKRNDMALSALSKIEGAVENIPRGCDRPYTYGKPLKLNTQGAGIVNGIVAKSITGAMTVSYASTTFWDKLVGEFCPAFTMAVVPLIDSALVIADTPTYRGLPGQGVWRNIGPDEYDNLDFAAITERPLRAVGILASNQLDTMPGDNAALLEIAGCFDSPNESFEMPGITSSSQVTLPAAGVIQYIRPPAWLSDIPVGFAASFDNNAEQGKPVRAENAAAVPKPADQSARRKSAADALHDMFNAYAHAYYTLNTLRGRSGSVSGKLRFDIAPGSIVRIIGRGERHLGGEDQLAEDMIGQVARITITINVEGLVASTAFQLTHLRTARENTSDRFAIDSHPLFGDSIHGFGRHGAPLVPGFAFEPTASALAFEQNRQTQASTAQTDALRRSPAAASVSGAAGTAASGAAAGAAGADTAAGTGTAGAAAGTDIPLVPANPPQSTQGAVSPEGKTIQVIRSTPGDPVETGPDLRATPGAPVETGPDLRATPGAPVERPSTLRVLPGDPFFGPPASVNGGTP